MVNIFTAFRGYSVLACVLVLMISAALLSKMPAWRLDLTEDGLYTLGDGTHELVSELSEPVTLTLYFSKSLAGELPQLKDYAQRIEDLLFEYQAINPQGLRVEVVDPEPFSDAEDLVTAAGLQGAPVTLGGDSLYLGLIASRGDGEQQVISFFNPERERFLEYDISQVIHRLGQARPPQVKILSGVQMFGGYDFASQRSTGPWAIVEQLRGVAEVEEIHPPQTRLGEEIDVLLLAHPQDLDEQTLYAVDQYLLSGGKALIFVDPHAEINARTPGQADSSELQSLFEAWGVEFDAEQIVGDRALGLRISTNAQSPAMPHVGIIGLPATSMSDESVMTAELETLNLASSGHFTLSGDSPLQWLPLLTSSDQAKLIPVEQYVAARDHSELLLDFEPAGSEFVLAAYLSGSVSSAFDQAPAAPDEDAEIAEDGGVEGGVAETDVVENKESAIDASASKHLGEGEIQVMLVADVDLLSDRLWVQVSNFFGQQVMVPWANNGDLVINAVENLGGSQALISLRSRGQYARPFDVVNELRNQAAEEFKQQEQVLMERLQDLEARIASLTPSMDAQAQGLGDGVMTLSEEQEAEIQAFETQRLETRKQLRQVQHQLNQSIDALEFRLRWLNMGLMPALLMLVMIGVFVHRRRNSGL